MPAWLRGPLNSCRVGSISGIGRARLIRGRFAPDAPRRIVGRVGDALQRAVKFRGGGVEKQKVAKAIRHQTPVADKRVAQDESGIVPNERIAHGRPVRDECEQHEQSDR
jgi:hypothetical protein